MAPLVYPRFAQVSEKSQKIMNEGAAVYLYERQANGESADWNS